jgi:hypothetical protein
MQDILQDVMGYLPLAGAISPELKILLLLERLAPIARPIAQMALGAGGFIWAHMAAGAEVAKEHITKAEFIPLMMILASPFVMMFPTPNSGEGSAGFKAKGFEAHWKGGIAFSFLVGGMLLFALVHWKNA